MKLNRKHLTTLLATLLLATISHSALAYNFIVNGIAYDINEDGTSVTVTYTAWPFPWSGGNYSDLTTANIPSSVTHNDNTYSVTSIGGQAFLDCGLTSVTIPNSVTSIGGGAFESCSRLTSVYITDLAAWCNIEFGNSSGNPLFYAHHLFLNSNEVKDLVFPNSVTSIGNYAFSGCTGLTSVTIPNSVTSIGDSAFAACSSLTSVTIGNSVTHIGVDAFSGTPWYNNQPDGLVYAGLVAYKYKGTMPDGTSIHINEGTLGIAGSAFSGRSGLTSVTIPNSVTSIGDWAFYNCSGLTSIDIPNSVTSIGAYAFSGCSGLTSVTIGNSVTTIGERAFSGCSGLTSVTIPNSVTSIGAYAFSGCTGLTSVTIGNSVTTIGERAFSGCRGLSSITIPNSVNTIGRNAFSSCSGLTSVNVASGNEKYDSRNNCNAIIETATNTLITGCKSTIIPNSVTSIGESAFSGCSGLTSVTIGNSVTTIGESAFSGCTGLTSVIFPNSVASIGKWAFSGCSGLTSVTIPNSVIFIDWQAFSGCSGLTNLTITGNGSWNKDLSGRNYSDIKTLKVGSEITDISGFGLNPDTVSSYAPVPPTCVKKTFSEYNAELHVPTTSIAAYFTAPYWSNFSNIINNLTEKVMLSQTEAEGIASDEFMLKATTIPADKEDEVVWSTSNPAVATVAEDGKVTLQSKGECRIFASLSSDLAVYASCLVKVNSSIKLDKTEATIAPNEMLVLTPTYDVADIAATSSDASVAIARVVTSNGVKKVQVVGVNYGTATITVASTEGDAPPATCKITVRDTVSGDVNGDGKVNVSDVSTLINMILGITPMDQTTGDVNGDGRVNVSDVSALINIILGIQ